MEPFQRFYELEIEDSDFYTTVLQPWMKQAKVGDVCPHLLPNGKRLRRENEKNVTFCECCGPEVWQWIME